MFTGIITATTKVATIKLQKTGMVLTIERPKKWKVKVGDSISVNGVCSTVVKNNSTLVFEYMPESLERSNIGSLHVGDIVNLEQSLRASDRLDGHIVQGHVDTIGQILSIKSEGNSQVFTIKIPVSSYLRFVASKGSIALEGISLTVVNVAKNNFSVKIISHTLSATNLGKRKVGDTVNIEFDVLAKYLENILNYKK